MIITLGLSGNGFFTYDSLMEKPLDELVEIIKITGKVLEKQNSKLKK